MTAEQARIVLVDDEQEFCRAVATYLASWATVQCATTCAEGLRLLEQSCPDIVLVDQRLPDGDGLTLLRFARNHCPDTARVLITAYTDRKVLQEAINELGIAYYIAKPVELPQLQLLLQQLWYTLLLRRSQEQLQTQLQEYYHRLEERIAERTQTLQQAYQELQQLVALREQMLRFLLHDLKAPLANLEMLWNELRQALAGVDHVHELLTLGSELIHTLRHLTSNMLLALTLESGSIPLRRERVELRELAERVCRHFTPALAAKDIQLATEMDQSLPPVVGDPALLERLLANLLENAIKYTPPGGHITLRLSASEDAVELEVRDTGVGMTEDDITAALTGHGSPSAQPTAGESSSGLGLPIIRHIAQLHGATLSIASEGRGTGTAFRIRFPLPGHVTLPLTQRVPE
mgnify:CR=1 FL=1